LKQAINLAEDNLFGRLRVNVSLCFPIRKEDGVQGIEKLYLALEWL